MGGNRSVTWQPNPNTHGYITCVWENGTDDWCSISSLPMDLKILRCGLWLATENPEQESE